MFGHLRGGLLAIVACTAGLLASGVATAHQSNETVEPIFQQAIPNIPGKSFTAVEVNYPPGASSQPHRHARSAFLYAYVLQGSVESKLNDSKSKIYKAGDSWSEIPGDLHTVSRNASKTKPAKLLAVFIVDSTDTELTFPIN